MNLTRCDAAFLATIGVLALLLAWRWSRPVEVKWKEHTLEASGASTSSAAIASAAKSEEKKEAASVGLKTTRRYDCPSGRLSSETTEAVTATSKETRVAETKREEKRETEIKWMTKDVMVEKIVTSQSADSWALTARVGLDAGLSKSWGLSIDRRALGPFTIGGWFDNANSERRAGGVAIGIRW